MKYIVNFLVTVCLFMSMTQSANAQKDYFKDLPENCSPEKVGAILSRHFIPSKHMWYGKGKWIHYAEVCTWYGALRYAEITGDKQLAEQLKDRFDLLVTTEKSHLPIMNHVDLNVFGCIPLELYKITKDKKYLEMGLSYADTQWTLPANVTSEEKAWADKGLSWQTRLWIDDMFMITILQAQAYHTTGKREYMDRAVKEMVVYLDELQRSNGLFYHAPDVPYFWARGNGWMAVGMAELLLSTPEDNPNHARILEGYRLMMKSLKDYQNKSGMWNQLIEGKAECPFELPGEEFVDLEFESLIVGVGDSFHIVVCFCLHYKYNTSAANTTIKCWKNSRETINFSLFLT